MAEKPNNAIGWEPGDGDVTEPSAGKKGEGWEVDERPPAQFFNWFWRQVSRWIDYLDNPTGTGDGPGLRATGGDDSGDGLHGVGGEPNGVGVVGTGSGSGNGVRGIASGSGAGVYGEGGNDSPGVIGAAENAVSPAGPPDRPGVLGLGGGSAPDVNGPGVVGFGARFGEGGVFVGGPMGGHGVRATGTDFSERHGGLFETESDTGNGVRGIATNQAGVRGIATGTGPGVEGSSGGGGAGVSGSSSSGHGGEFSGAGGAEGASSLRLSPQSLPSSGGDGDLLVRQSDGMLYIWNDGTWKRIALAEELPD